MKPLSINLKPYPQHPVRVISMITGMFIVCFMVQTEEETETVDVVLPMEVFTHFKEGDESLAAYSFSPYLENLFPFDVKHPHMVSLNPSSIISITPPTSHLLRNYYFILTKMVDVQDDIDGVVEQNNTIH